MDNKEKILGRGFKALRPEIEYADDVIAPPYDVLNSEEARALAEGKPFSFLHISKPEIDLPKDISADDPLVYRQGLENLESMIKKNILVRDDKESLFVYKISTKDHSQTGIAFVASIEKNHYLFIRFRQKITVKLGLHLLPLLRRMKII